MFEIVIIIAIGLLSIILIVWIKGERGRLLQPSTWKFMKASGIKRILNFKAIHAYVYGRWIKEYIYVLINMFIPLLGRRGKKWLSERYHGKVITLDQAGSIIKLDKDIPLQNLEQIIPYSKAKEIILHAPLEIAVFQCGCRQNRENPCQPIQVCMVIGQPFVDFVLDHHPDTSKRLTQSEALTLLREEHERGHLHSAWFKDAMMDRFYAICNCCKCCCGGIQAMVQYGIPMISSSGYIADIDKDVCNGCGNCVNVCAFNALILQETSTLDWEKCMGCGICVDQCPLEAIQLVRDTRKGVPFEVQTLIETDIHSFN